MRHARIERLALLRRRAQIWVKAIQNPERLDRSYAIGPARKSFEDGAEVICGEEFDGGVYALFAFDLEESTCPGERAECQSICCEVVDDLYDEFGREDVEHAFAAATGLCAGG